MRLKNVSGLWCRFQEANRLNGGLPESEAAGARASLEIRPGNPLNGELKQRVWRPLRLGASGDQRRWKIEKLFAWLQNTRRLVVDMNVTPRTLEGSFSARRL